MSFSHNNLIMLLLFIYIYIRVPTYFIETQEAMRLDIFVNTYHTDVKCKESEFKCLKERDDLKQIE